MHVGQDEEYGSIVWARGVDGHVDGAECHISLDVWDVNEETQKLWTVSLLGEGETGLLLSLGVCGSPFCSASMHNAHMHLEKILAEYCLFWRNIVE